VYLLLNLKAMKFIKKMSDFKNEKVMFGLFAVLFMGSIVQTGAILKSQSVSQVAQVKTSTLTDASLARGCLTTSPSYNQLFSNPFDVGNPVDYTFFVGMNITNNCARPVNIIDPSTLNSQDKNGVLNQVSYMTLDRLDGATNLPVNISLPDNNFEIDPYAEIVNCVNCPSGSISYRFSPVGTYYYQNATSVRTFPLAIGETRSFQFLLDVSVPHSSGFGWWLKAKPFQFNWFYDSAYADNVVLESEIKTHEFSSLAQEAMSTDYLIVSQDGADGSSCQDGTSLGFNDMNEPVCQ
jgi:hypothetical protein